MRKLISFLIILFVADWVTPINSAAEPGGYLSVSGPCNLEFPKDHGPHPGYRTEWWYYTGNLQAESGEGYGFQLTFFSPSDQSAR